MAAGFIAPNQAQCEHYAAFASHLGRTSFDFLYWMLFFIVILILFMSSFNYGSTVDKCQKYDNQSADFKKKFKRCFLFSTMCATVSTVAVVMEVFALLALQFCEGEDLISLYWSTWTVLQVGSLIAMMGIMLAVYNQIRGNKNPPWALALGTPVLVVAGLGHTVQASMRKRIKKVADRSRSRSRSRQGRTNSKSRSAHDLPMSRHATIGTLRIEDSDRESTMKSGNVRPQNNFPARLIGYQADGGPILQFLEDPGDLPPERGSVLGRNEDGHVLVAFDKAMTKMITNNAAAAADDELLSPSSTLPGSLTAELRHSNSDRRARCLMVRVLHPHEVEAETPKISDSARLWNANTTQYAPSERSQALDDEKQSQDASAPSQVP